LATRIGRKKFWAAVKRNLYGDPKIRKRRMGFNSAFKGLTLILLTWTKWWTPARASKWRMGFNSAFKGLKVFRFG
jgi:hypothetical protein